MGWGTNWGINWGVGIQADIPTIVSTDIRPVRVASATRNLYADNYSSTRPAIPPKDPSGPYMWREK